jgi:hypothetical protein
LIDSHNDCTEQMLVTERECDVHMYGHNRVTTYYCPYEFVYVLSTRCIHVTICPLILFRNRGLVLCEYEYMNVMKKVMTIVLFGMNNNNSSKNNE